MGSEGGEEAPAAQSVAAYAPPPVKCYVELLTLHPVVLNYTSSSGVGFANMQKLGAPPHVHMRTQLARARMRMHTRLWLRRGNPIRSRLQRDVR